MTRLHLPDDDDDMTKNNKEEGYARVRLFVGTYVCGDGCVFWNHRHIVIRTRNLFTFSGLTNDDQPVTMAASAQLRLSFNGRRVVRGGPDDPPRKP
jgi:hypothetical protein